MKRKVLTLLMLAMLLFACAAQAETDMTAEQILKTYEAHVQHTPPEDSLLESGHPHAQAVLEALRAEYGIDRALLKKYAFCLIPSPVESGWADYCVAFNQNIEDALYQTGKLNRFNGPVFHYAARLGSYLVRIDTRTGEAVETVCLHTMPESARSLPADTPFLRRYNWTGGDLAAFDRVYDAVIELLEEIGPSGASGELEGRIDTLLRAAGADAQAHPAVWMEDVPVTEAQTMQIAHEAALEATGKTEQEFQAYYQPPVAHYGGQGMYHVAFAPINWQASDGADSITIPVDAHTGEAGDAVFSNGFG